MKPKIIKFNKENLPVDREVEGKTFEELQKAYEDPIITNIKQGRFRA